MTNANTEEEESRECYFCSTTDVDTKEYTNNGKTGRLCDVCASTFSGNSFFYPEIHPEYSIAQLISQHTNYLLKALESTS